MMFPFILGNNIPDGIILGIGYMLIPALWVTLVSMIFSIKNASEYLFGLPLICGDMASRCSNEFYRQRSVYSLAVMQDEMTVQDYTTIAVWLIISIAVMVCAFLFFDRKKTEEIGGHSDSIFAYKTCIPLFMLPIIMLLGGKLGIGILYGICAFVLYVIYRRSAKLKLPDIIVIGVVLVLGNIPINLADVLNKAIIGY